MKKIIFFIIIVLVIFAFSACKIGNEKTATTATNIAVEIKETGNIIDITNKNNQIIFANPGDIILIDFMDKEKSPNQWSFKSPVKQEIISLKEHNVITENDSRVKIGEVLNEWKLKILKDSDFEIIFTYENSLKPGNPIQYFRAQIISGKKQDETPDIIIQDPKTDDVLGQKFVLRGYLKNTDTTVYFKILNNENAAVAQGLIHIVDNSSYFEKNIDIKKIISDQGILMVYQTNKKDNAEYNIIKIPVKFKKEK